MNEKTSFWKGVWTTVGIILAGIVTFLFLRGRTKGDRPPSVLANDTNARIEATRQEIKKDSDEELKNRFNALAKGKEEKK